ncbi:unnamed protein product [Cladocopium goreaui]|uniref:Cytochrome b5 heme-binding domain-containing protein n=1 Tax=Cladocopium goreaui TaxID=2562237 RepID=A0A9P1BRU3_9DINO|nr:unnamed protein product [Cladocopium goreaui]
MVPYPYQEYYGCAYGNEAYTWCEVDPGSCPEEARDPLGIRPAWDYCVNDNFDIDWHPKHVADKGVLSELTGLYIAAAFILAAAAPASITHFVSPAQQHSKWKSPF